MRRILLASLALLLALLACGGPPAPAERPAVAAAGWATFAVESFSVNLPANWPEGSSEDEQVVYTVSDGLASLWVKTWQLIPSLVAKGVQEWVDGNEAVTLLERSKGPEKVRLGMALTEDGRVLRMETLLVYCDAKTYEVTAVAAQDDFERYIPLFTQAVGSITCSREGLAPYQENGALGMVVIPSAVDQDEFSPAAYQEALALARRNGVQVSHYYFHWGDLETAPGVYDWSVPDYIVEANALEGLQLSIVMSIIHTTVSGRIPDDLAGRSFDDPVFVGRLSDFLAAFAERYAGRLHYLAIGNEVNDYFVTHREQIPAYAEAFQGARTAIHAVNPDLPVGIVFAYHDAETQDTIDIIRELNLGDYIAYTMYLYNQGFHFRRDPAEIGGYLDRMVALAGGTPAAIVETGWSTASKLEGSQEGQAEYVRQLFAALSQRREDFRFVSYFAMHDPRPESCESDALTFFKPGNKPDPAFMQVFVTFICYFGLRESDGTPKLGWDVWVQEAGVYYLR